MRASKQLIQTWSCVFDASQDQKIECKKTAPQGSCHKTQTALMVLGVVHFGGVHASVHG
jgi:hypothetical protein